MLFCVFVLLECVMPSTLNAAEETGVTDRSNHVLPIVVWYSPMPGPSKSVADFKDAFSTLAEAYKSVSPDTTVEAFTEISLGWVSDAQVVTPVKLQNALNRACTNLTADSTVVFLFIGHGDVDNAQGDQRRMWLDGGTFIYRNEVLNTLKRASPRLIVFLTEMCAGAALTEHPRRVVEYGVEQASAKMFEGMFIRPKGIVDIASSSFVRENDAIEADELSWCPVSGGMFSRALVEAMKAPSDAVLANADKNLWPVLFKDVYNGTRSNFASFRASLMKRYPKPADLSNAPQFGFAIDDATSLYSQQDQRPQQFGLADGNP